MLLTSLLIILLSSNVSFLGFLMVHKMDGIYSDIFWFSAAKDSGSPRSFKILIIRSWDSFSSFRNLPIYLFARARHFNILNQYHLFKGHRNTITGFRWNHSLQSETYWLTKTFPGVCSHTETQVDGVQIDAHCWRPQEFSESCIEKIWTYLQINFQISCLDLEIL